MKQAILTPEEACAKLCLNNAASLAFGVYYCGADDCMGWRWADSERGYAGWPGCRWMDIWRLRSRLTQAR